MSDNHDRMIHEVGEHIGRIYSLIASVCRALPLPINLPNGPVIEGSEAIPAVKRVVEIIEDQPVDEIIQAGIWGGCLHWLAAAHLYSALLDHEDQVLELEIGINLTTAGEGLVLIAKAIREQE